MGLERIENWVGHMALLFAGGFMVLETFAWSNGTAAAIGFAISIGVLLAAAGLTAVSTLRGHVVQAALSGMIGAVAGWTIIATHVFSTSAEAWLAFASGLAIIGLSTVALALHEATEERVVHHLEVGEPQRAKDLVS